MSLDQRPGQSGDQPPSRFVTGGCSNINKMVDLSTDLVSSVSTILECRLFSVVLSSERVSNRDAVQNLCKALYISACVKYW